VSNRSKGLAVTMYYDMERGTKRWPSLWRRCPDNGTLVTTKGRRGDHFEMLAEMVDGWFMILRTLRIYTLLLQQWAFSAGAMGEAEMCRRKLRNMKQSQCGWFTSQWIRKTPRPSSPDLHECGVQKRRKKWRRCLSSRRKAQLRRSKLPRRTSKRIYWGTENGGFFRSLDAARHGRKSCQRHFAWTFNHSNRFSAKLGAEFCSSRSQTLATRTSFCSRTWKSWEDVDKGQLPDVPMTRS